MSHDQGAIGAGGSALTEFKSGYLVLLAALLGVAVGLAGTIVYSMPFFLKPLQAEFGWTRLEVAGAATSHTIGLIVGAPIAGRLCDRFGVPRTALVSAVLYAIVLFLMSQAVGSLPTLYAGYLVASFLAAGTTYVCYSRIVSSSFDKGRGLALGITMSGAGLMATIIPLFLPEHIAENGWRSGYLVLAALVLVAIPINLALIFFRQASAKAQARREGGMSIGEALRTRQFWTIWIGIFLLSITVIGSHLFLVSIIEEFGVASGEATKMVAMYGAAIVVGRIGTGFLLDRFHGPYVASFNFLLPAIGMVLVAQLGAPAAAVYAIALGLAAGAEGDTIGYLAGRYFGLKSYSEIFGYLFTALVCGVAVGPLVVGGLRDYLGSFTPMMYLGATNCIIVSLMFLSLGAYRTFGEEPESLMDTQSDGGDGELAQQV